MVFENEYLKFEELEVVLIEEETNVDVKEVIDNIFSEVEKVIEINILLLVGKLKIVSRKVNNRVIYVEQQISIKIYGCIYVQFFIINIYIFVYVFILILDKEKL